MPRHLLRCRRMHLSTHFLTLAQLKGEPLGDTLALVLAKAVVNKLSDSLEVVIVKKLVYTGS